MSFVIKRLHSTDMKLLDDNYTPLIDDETSHLFHSPRSSFSDIIPLMKFAMMEFEKVISMQKK
jgi:hypothetical protein